MRGLECPFQEIWLGHPDITSKLEKDVDLIQSVIFLSYAYTHKLVINILFNGKTEYIIFNCIYLYIVYRSLHGPEVAGV